MPKHKKGRFKRIVSKLGSSLKGDLNSMKKSMKHNWAGHPMPVAGRRPGLPKLKRGRF